MNRGLHHRHCRGDLRSGPRPGRGPLTSAAQAASRAPASARYLYFEQTAAVNCQGRAQERPATFTLACADANDYLSHLSWANWSPGMASATGVQEENGITYCRTSFLRLPGRSPVRPRSRHFW